MPKQKTAKTKIQQVVDFLKATGDRAPGEVMKHFKEKGFKVDYGEVRTAKRRAWPDKYPMKGPRRKSVARAPQNPSTNGVNVSAIIAAAQLVEQVGGVAAAKQAISAVEKIRRLPA